jgi:hypothetical protein
MSSGRSTPSSRERAWRPARHEDQQGRRLEPPAVDVHREAGGQWGAQRIWCAGRSRPRNCSTGRFCGVSLSRLPSERSISHPATADQKH